MFKFDGNAEPFKFSIDNIETTVLQHSDMPAG